MHSTNALLERAGAYGRQARECMHSVHQLATHSRLVESFDIRSRHTSTFQHSASTYWIASKLVENRSIVVNKRKMSTDTRQEFVDRKAPTLDLASALESYNTPGAKNKPVYITTPIFYVNSVPHIGHVYTAYITDALARWWRLVGADVVLATGTDEHGLKIAQAAKAKTEGDGGSFQPAESCKAFCDVVSRSFKELFDQAGITYTRFIRTTDSDHQSAVKEMWRILQEKGFLYKGKHEGWYCVSDEVFYAERDVMTQSSYNAKIAAKATGDSTAENADAVPNSAPSNTGDTTDKTAQQMVTADTGKVVEWVQEENYLLRWADDADSAVRNWINDNHAIAPSLRKTEIINLLAETFAQPLSVSRPVPRQLWGIEVPNDKDHLVYVWLDALTNYLTVAGFPWDDSAASASCWPADYHVVGKDIAKFHCVYWPSFLTAAGIALPHKVIVHGHWTVNSVKMSKSLGNVIDPLAKLQELSPDGFRYFLLKEGRLGSDGDYENERAINIVNADLADTYGNLLGRCTSVKVNPMQCYPEPNSASYTDADRELLGLIREMPEKAHSFYRDADFSRGIEVVMETLYKSNNHMNENKPWALAKDPAQSERLRNVLYIAMEAVRTASLLLIPVAPGIANVALDRLGVSEDDRHVRNACEAGAPSPGSAVIASATPLFNKISKDTPEKRTSGGPAIDTNKRMKKAKRN
ncbi:methionyl-tRNA synthetase [Sphaeroforma arctica JP610]|uniref:methionine--tRNA ligase n=1 Tax=Sphaeroforma arctica JP610 TaxID=667725 RepID=A0A0L0G9K9_9EUKA|nr:methionyl-tRNA synthetase [Sphaeroforma arctica JP610]KNC85685.1 methionyl-tRNA synthetase [Sphaeroforma arctica JP610]|eukprot:XP_014159587.1 methionyl-tRNA synthetase [Sphaeroforma arctica JP610]